MPQMMTHHQLSEKLERLSPFQRVSVEEFIEFLLSKQAHPEEHKKSVLLHVSVWNDEDIQRIERVQQDMNTWTLPTF
jgi:hypothetical protein